VFGPRRPYRSAGDVDQQSLNLDTAHRFEVLRYRLDVPVNDER
jgi:hypothetical protein